jgi:hypothetical protein
MTADSCAAEFLGQLEREEMSVLSWGLADGFFSESELEERAEQFLARDQAAGIAAPFGNPWELVEALLERQLVWKLPETQRYRTRMAETMRLFARLRQIFPDPQNAAWRKAPNLVADYRLIVRPRLYPTRAVLPSSLLEELRSQIPLSELEESVIRSLLRVGTPEERHLARFQMRATDRILRMVGQDGTFGTVVSAGTGSGKTLAFYLPAYTAMANRMSGEYWTKCLALYPRNELLKDQLREALENARRISATLIAHGKRKLVVAALYGDVPNAGRNILAGNYDSWHQLNLDGRKAFECPFVRCPRCGQSMAWLESDIQRNVECLVCTESQCSERVEPDEIRLTRERMLAEPADVLFTSTEMLNQRLSSARYARLFGVGVRSDRRPEFVLIDEAHAYEGVHGAHVALVLRRWKYAAQAHPHFVGLSATLADAPRFFAELVGIGPGNVAEVWPEPEELRGEGAEYLLALRGDPSSGTSLLSTTIQSLMLLRRVLAAERRDPNFGSRVFAFTDNLDVINRLYHNLLDAEGWDSFGRPNRARTLGSLANLRSPTLPNARERFEIGQNWAMVEDIGHVLAPGARVRVSRTSSQDAGVDANAGIVVATSALEVGLDDPEVGAVLQHKAPQSPAAFLQRKGRAGRRQSMRPWTVVVLSDYGRDRAAYQSYDQLFSPFLPARHLPLGNRAILKMQATFALFDWLAHRLPRNEWADPWADFSQPAGENQNPRFAADAARRQSLYAGYLRSLLEEATVREEFEHFLRRSLACDEQEATAILWEPPRALLTEAVPTLLRRLERGWRKSESAGLEQHEFRAPLPEFVPRTLFSDLQLPEVTVRIPRQGQLPERFESMPVAQAMREFAPGRVSRRFGVTNGRERHWIAPGNGSEVVIDSFCPPADRVDLGRSRYIRSDGSEASVPVFRPYAIDVALTPSSVQQSSNSFLEWHAEIIPTARGQEVDIPDGSPWQEILKSILVHSHNLGLPVEVRRFAVGATASVGRGTGPQVVSTLEFVWNPQEDTTEPAGIGFVGDVDGIQLIFQYPEKLYERCRRDDRLIRGLRAARFRDLVRAAPGLNGLANDFQREWLAQVYVSTVTATALLELMSIEQAVDAVHRETSRTSTREVLETILQWSDIDPDSDGNVQCADDTIPKRLKELSDLLAHPSAKGALHQAARALSKDIDEEWEEWLRARFKSGLGAAFIDATEALCPRMDSGTLLVDLRARTETDQRDQGGDSPDTDEIWITESTIGGMGFVEEFLKRYAEDPRRYFRLFEAALAPSDLEFTSEELVRVLEMITSGRSECEPLSSAFGLAREASSHVDTVAALRSIRNELARKGVQPTPTLMISLNARILQPGSNAETDRFLAQCLEEWQDAEQRLGVDIDTRVFAFVKSFDPAIEQALHLNVNANPNDARVWRYGVLCGMFWPRGAQIRGESLRAWNPYERLPDCDRLMLLTALTRVTREVMVSNPSWFEELAGHLEQYGAAELIAESGESRVMAEALLRIGGQPVDSGALLVHARVTGIRREGGLIIAEIELPEAFQ